MIKFKNIFLAILMISFSLKSIGFTRLFDLSKSVMCCEEGDNSCEKSSEVSKSETNDVFLHVSHPFTVLFSNLLSQKVYSFKPVIFFSHYLSIFSPPPEA